VTISLERKMFASWNAGLSALLHKEQDKEFPKLLMKLLGSIVTADEPLLLITLGGEMGPYVIAEYEPAPLQQRKFDEYLRAYFVLDPCYRAFRERDFTGYYHFATLAPDGFSYSKTYQAYFANNYSDEIGFIFALENGAFASICASRLERKKFSASEKMFFQSIAPVVIQLLRRFFRDETSTKSLLQPSRAERMESMLENFGRRSLSEREYDVMQLILRGYSMKAIASTIHRSIDTVKKHHRSIYDKLGVTSQRELIPTFIDLLDLALNADLPPDTDTLEYYLTRQ
jgi:DNA-binding CsgD family transcriptional regulator